MGQDQTIKGSNDQNPGLVLFFSFFRRHAKPSISNEHKIDEIDELYEYIAQA